MTRFWQWLQLVIACALAAWVIAACALARPERRATPPAAPAPSPSFFPTSSALEVSP